MALRKLDKSFAPKTKEIRYLNKTFPEFRQSLIDFAKVYYPNTYSDFNEASPGMMFIEMAAYVGDVLSYYIDSQFKENLIEYAQEKDSILSIAQSLGYKPRPTTAASTILDVYQLCPALGVSSNYEPDTRFMLRINAGLEVSAVNYSGKFYSSAIVDFSDPSDREVNVYAVDGLSKPLTYLLKKKVRVNAGTRRELKQVFGAPMKFSKITIPDSDVIEIISVIDTNGNRWYEVDYLAQDLVFEDKDNLRVAVSNESVAPYYILKIKREPRRFTTRYDSDFKLQLHFGSGVIEDTDSRVNLEPNKIASDEYTFNLASTSLDPSDFLSTKSYGLAPSNTELTITYTIGGGIQSNVPNNSITTIDNIVFLNDTTGFSPTEIQLFDEIKRSVAVNNPESATGGKQAESVEEIRQNALSFFNAQNRLVTPEDYVVRSYAMPAKYGGVAKSFVAREDQILAINDDQMQPIPGTEFVNDPVGYNKVNLYVLGYNKDKKLTRLNSDTKRNLQKYLENYRILTDEINIMDAYVVNIGVEFDIIVYRNFNMNEVLARAIDAVSQFFLIDKWDINQPIVLNDLLLEIAAVEGVQSVTKVEVFNKYGYKDGADYENYNYDIPAAIENGVVYPSIDPCIFELRYPESDIIGNARQ